MAATPRDPTTIQPHQVETFEDLRMVVFVHCAVTDERHINQQTINSGQQLTNADHEKRLTAMERRIMWFSGAAAAAGSVLGALATKAFGV